MTVARVVSLGARLGSGGAVMADAAAASLRIASAPARIDPLAEPPDPALIHCFGAGQCLQLGLCPWRRVGAVTVVLASRPGALYRHEGELTRVFGPVRIALVAEAVLQAAILAAASPGLVAEAEARVPLHLSSRRWDGRRLGQAGIALLAVTALALLCAPVLTLAALSLWAIFVLVVNMALKIAAAIAALRRPAPPPPGTAPVPMRLPVVSIIVALYRETEIIGALLQRLGRLDYPADLLDICLVLEDDDLQTRAMLDAAALPGNVQVIAVPQGTIRTKPRALNFALNFTRGQIVGIYDAEDAPAPDQIRKVVQRFAERGPQVACLQGALDYYNHSSNWLARCFTLEYATWFRLYLPGIARLGLVVPLGGTTLFLRRHALRVVGGWEERGMDLGHLGSLRRGGGMSHPAATGRHGFKRRPPSARRPGPSSPTRSRPRCRA